MPYNYELLSFPPKSKYVLVKLPCVRGGCFVSVGNWPLPLHQLKTASGKTFLDDLTEGVPKTLSCLADYCEKTHGKKAAINAQDFAESAMRAFPDSRQVLQQICLLQEALLILREEIKPIHHHRVALKLKQAAMAASEAAHLQTHMDVQPRFTYPVLFRRCSEHAIIEHDVLGL